jgi:hypothetical protein
LTINKERKNMRIKKFIIEYGYICDNGYTVALANKQEMKEPDLSMALAMVDPFNHSKWMRQIGTLIKRGDKLVISMNSMSEEHGMVGRVLKIIKN